MAGDLAQATLLHLPMAVLILDATGRIITGNAAAGEMLDLATATDLPCPPHLAGTHGGPSYRPHALKCQQCAVVPMACKLGNREVRVTLSRLPAQDLLSAILEDVTDRRALERSLQAQPAAAAPPAPVPAQDAFAQLAKSLQDTIEKQSTARSQKQPEAAPEAPKPAPRPARPAAETAPAPAATAPSTEQSKGPPPGPAAPGKGAPFVPEPVRQSFERTGEAILIGRGEAPLFATSKAATLLGYDSASSLMADAGLWQHFKAVAQQPKRTSLPLPSGESIELEVVQAACRG